MSGKKMGECRMVVVGKRFLHFAYCGFVVEIQPLNCQNLNCCSPSNVNQVGGGGGGGGGSCLEKI